jgi:hypothetical protein
VLADERTAVVHRTAGPLPSASASHSSRERPVHGRSVKSVSRKQSMPPSLPTRPTGPRARPRPSCGRRMPT